MQSVSLLSRIKSLIDNASVVSFDIFDTLLLRPYVTPNDMFFDIQERFHIPGFANARINADHMAWDKNTTQTKQDVRLDEIYSYIPQFQLFQSKEIEFESDVLTLNPETYAIWEYAKKSGKKIILASDMYLPKEELEKILARKGLTGYDKLYLSNETFETKHTGRLYQTILKDQQIAPNEILHIGDNAVSDFKIPKSMGINAFLYTKIIDRFLSENPAGKTFLLQNQTHDGALFLGSMVLGWHLFTQANPSASYWHKIGYLYGGPACYGYMKMLEKDVISKNITDILFVARDGYSLKRIFNLFNQPAVKTHYVYAPRYTNLLCRLDLGREKNVQQERIQTLQKCLHDKGYDLDCNDILKSPELIKIQQEESAEYDSYIQSFGITSPTVALVDAISISFSAHKLVAKFLPSHDVIGYYWAALIPEDKTYDDLSFERFIDERGHLPLAHFIEFLMTAPELPIKTIKNKQPVYRDNHSSFEQIKIDIYPDISDAELAYSVNAEKYGINPASPMVRKWLESFVETPTDLDILEMNHIKNGTDSGHTIYASLFPEWDSIIKCTKRYGVTIKQNKNVKRISFCKIPLWKVKQKEYKTGIKQKFYLFGFIPVFVRKK